MRPTTFAFLLFALLLSISPATAQASRTVTKSFPLPTDGSFSLDTYKGSYDIQAWDKAEVSVEARIESSEDWLSGDDEESVELVDIEFDAGAKYLSVRTSYRRLERERHGWKFWDSMSSSLPDVHYTIKVPATASVRVEDYKSEKSTIVGLKSDLTFETYKGSVSIEDFSGALRGETYKGDVKVAYSSYTKDARFETYKGDVVIRIPASAGLTVRGELGDRADFSSDFDLEERSTSRKRRSDRRVSGDVNGGGPELSFESDKGSIRVSTH